MMLLTAAVAIIVGFVVGRIWQVLQDNKEAAILNEEEVAVLNAYQFRKEREKQTSRKAGITIAAGAFSKGLAQPSKAS